MGSQRKIALSSTVVVIVSYVAARLLLDLDVLMAAGAAVAAGILWGALYKAYEKR